jgi:hypothetical protein
MFALHDVWRQVGSSNPNKNKCSYLDWVYWLANLPIHESTYFLFSFPKK